MTVTTDQTLRYRAAGRVSYALALAALTEYAREHPEPGFAFGPLVLEELESQGLEITGPELGGPEEVLAAVPGLVRTAA